MNDSRFHLTIGSQLENIELVQVVLDDTLTRLGLDDESRHWIELAVREAVANAIRHGNQENPDRRVEVDCKLVGEDLQIRVFDEGEGFEPEQVEDPRSPENLLNPDGRGIFYMRSFMDQIDYSFRPEGGTVVTLSKNLARRRSHDHEEDDER